MSTILIYDEKSSISSDKDRRNKQFLFKKMATFSFST